MHDIRINGTADEAWDLVSLMMTLAGKVTERRLSDEEYELVDDLQNDVHHWAAINRLDDYTREALYEACESVWMALIYQQ